MKNTLVLLLTATVLLIAQTAGAVEATPIRFLWLTGTANGNNQTFMNLKSVESRGFKLMGFRPNALLSSGSDGSIIDSGKGVSSFALSGHIHVASSITDFGASVSAILDGATSVGGVALSDLVRTSDSRLTDSRDALSIAGVPASALGSPGQVLTYDGYGLSLKTPSHDANAVSIGGIPVDVSGTAGQVLGLTGANTIGFVTVSTGGGSSGSAGANVAVVDSIAGSDVNGAVGGAAFATISAAVAACSAGQAVEVRPGSYAITTALTLKDGVPVHCERGVTVSLTTANSAILSGGASGGVCAWTGDASVLVTATSCNYAAVIGLPPGGPTKPTCLGAAGQFIFECESFYAVANGLKHQFYIRSNSDCAVPSRVVVKGTVTVATGYVVVMAGGSSPSGSCRFEAGSITNTGGPAALLGGGYTLVRSENISTAVTPFGVEYAQSAPSSQIEASAITNTGSGISGSLIAPFDVSAAGSMTGVSNLAGSFHITASSILIAAYPFAGTSPGAAQSLVIDCPRLGMGGLNSASSVTESYSLQINNCTITNSGYTAVFWPSAGQQVTLCNCRLSYGSASAIYFASAASGLTVRGSLELIGSSSTAKGIDAASASTISLRGAVYSNRDKGSAVTIANGTYTYDSTLN